MKQHTSSTDSSALNKELAYFDQLPDELLVHIFSYLNNDEIAKGISLTDRRNNRICVVEFFINLHGDIIRFQRWQKEEIKQIEESISKIKKSCSLSFSHPINEAIDTSATFLSKVGHHVIFGSKFLVFISLIAMLMFAGKNLIANYKILQQIMQSLENNSITPNEAIFRQAMIGDQNERNYILLTIPLGLALFILITLLDDKRALRLQQHTFQQQAPSENLINNVRQLILDHPEILKFENNNLSINRMQFNRTTIKDLLGSLQRDLKIIKELEKELNTALFNLRKAKINRLSSINFSDSIHHYAQSTFVLWQKKEANLARPVEYKRLQPT